MGNVVCTDPMRKTFYAARICRSGAPLFVSSFRYEEIFEWVMIEICTLIGYTIYRRGFHYKKSDIAVMLLLLIFLFL